MFGDVRILPPPLLKPAGLRVATVAVRFESLDYEDSALFLGIRFTCSAMTSPLSYLRIFSTIPFLQSNFCGGVFSSAPWLVRRDRLSLLFWGCRPTSPRGRACFPAPSALYLCFPYSSTPSDRSRPPPITVLSPFRSTINFLPFPNRERPSWYPRCPARLVLFPIQARWC